MCALLGNGVTVGGWGGCCSQSVGRLCVCFAGVNVGRLWVCFAGVSVGSLCVCVHCWGKVVTVGGLLSSKCKPPGCALLG